MAHINARTPRALVIGGGPAGSIAAVLLARRRWAVTLVEQQPSGRDKVCGECLSPTGIDVLERAGVRHRLDPVQPVDIVRTLLHPPGDPSLAMDLPRRCIGISRRAMDGLLLDAARDAGVTIRQPVRCEWLAADQPACRLRDLTTNRLETVTADAILLADGKGALIDPKPAATGDLGVKAHFAAVNGPRDAVELFALDGHYAGLNPIQGGCWNLAMSVPVERVRGLRGDFDRLLMLMLRDNAQLARRLGKAGRISDWSAAPLPRFTVASQPFADGVIPIGNAAAALEPIGGEGMGLAMRSAEIAAEAIHAAAAAGKPARLADIAPQFSALWRTRSRAGRLAALALSRPAIAQNALSLLAANFPLQRGLLGLIGK